MRCRRGEDHRRGAAFGPECVQHRDCTVGEVGHGKVGVPIAVEVAHRNRLGIDSDRNWGRRRGGEVSRSIAQQDRRGTVGEVGHGEVEKPIAVEVAHRNRPRIHTNRYRGCRSGGKVSRSIAQQDRHRAGRRTKRVVPALVGHGQVEKPIAVEVAHGNGVRTAFNRHSRTGGEVPRSIALQDRHRAGRIALWVVSAPVGHGQIEFPIADEVAHCNRKRTDSNCNGGRWSGAEVS